VITAVRETNPGFIFLAEAYWDLEWSLMQQGFDYRYDKRLYDPLLGGSADEVRLHLLAERTYQNARVRFWRITTSPGPRRRSDPAVFRRRR
jgi:hypothetical protein